MEYTDECPNCNKTLYVEEEDRYVTIKTRPGLKGVKVTRCPDCQMKLEIIEGQLSVVEDE